MIKKILLEIEILISILQRDSDLFKSGQSTHQFLLDSYLKNGNTNLEEVFEELFMDKSDFVKTLYDIEIRLRALRDMVNPFNLKVDEIIKELKDNDIVPYRISEIEDVDGLSFYFKKEEYQVYLEVYSDLEMGYIVSDDKNKKIIANIDIKHIKEFIYYIKES